MQEMTFSRQELRSRGLLVALAAILIFLACGLRLAFGVAPPETAERAAQESGVSAAEDIPEVLRRLAERNPETEAFVEGYPGTVTASDEIVLDVEAGEVPLFLQWDPRWGYFLYGTESPGELLGLSGCGPTALSMAVVALTGNTAFHPQAVAEYALASGYRVPGCGSAWTLISEGAEHFGLVSEELPLWKDSMVQALQQGKVLICCVGPGDFTDCGHFLVLCGYTDDGFEIRDPNSRANSEKRWDYDTLAGQITALWALTKAP